MKHDYFHTDIAVEKYQRGCEIMLQSTEIVPGSKHINSAMQVYKKPIKTH